jgi:hypothetical protein
MHRALQPTVLICRRPGHTWAGAPLHSLSAVEVATPRQPRTCQILRARSGVQAVLERGMLCHVAAWVGVDVGRKRKGFDVAVIDERRVLALQSHLTRTQVVDLAMENRPTVIAIDSPCCCAPEGWTARDGELQLARSICGIRWTPDARHV